MKNRDEFNIQIEGHVKILEYEENDFKYRTAHNVLLDKKNAVNKENASILIARGITHRPNGNIFYMCFGNGGATIDPLGNVIYNPPNVSGAADLYNQTFFAAVDDTQGAAGSGNYMAVRHINGSLFSYADIYCVIGKNEPFTQVPLDTVGDLNLNTQQFSFSEIGLKTADNLLITHITFAPILKSAIRIIECIYTLRITID